MTPSISQLMPFMKQHSHRSGKSLKQKFYPSIYTLLIINQEQPGPVFIQQEKVRTKFL